MMELIKECPLCQSQAFESYLTCKDFTVSHETFELVRCKVCCFVITSPRPEEHDLGKYYQSEDYISHSDKTRSPIDLIYRTARGFSLSWKVNLLEKYLLDKSHRRLLDFGCGTGDFLLEAQRRGYLVTGVEPSEKARAIATKKTNSIIQENLTQVNEKGFHAITLWHVLEHLPDLHSTIVSLKKSLTENGIIVIAVPNHESEDAKKYKGLWAGYDVPRHLWHFSKDNMRKLLQLHEFTLVKIIPMRLDAFYVSMLSEKYKQGQTSIGGLLSAVSSGLTSNRKAKQDLNYSSLIYIARKK